MKVFFIGIVLSLFFLNIEAQLDPSFNGKGFVIHENAAGGEGHDFAQGIAIDSQGRILTTGFSRNTEGNIDMVVWRYLENGSLDRSFAGKGFVVHSNAAGGQSDDEGKAIAIDKEGRIVVVGRSRNERNNDDMVIWRYLANGSLDKSFAEKGFALHHSAAGGESHDYGYALIIDTYNRIVVTGESYAPGFPPQSEMVVWRYTSEGILDRSLAQQGWIVQGNDWDWGYAVRLDSENRIVVAGKSMNPYGMAIWRYLEDGSPDFSLAEKGWVVHNTIALEDYVDTGKALAIDKKGKLLVAGRCKKFDHDSDMALWRCQEDGSLDKTLGEKGWVSHGSAAKGKGYDTARAIAIDSLDRIIVVGHSTNPQDNLDMTIWRYRSDGTLDASLNGKGWISFDSTAGGKRHDLGSCVAIDRQDRIVVGGWSFNFENNFGMTIWRYR